MKAARVAAPTAAVTPAASTIDLARTVVTVCDARTKLPIPKARIVDRATGAPLPTAPGTTPGTFELHHAPDQEAEIRAADYGTLVVRLEGRPILAELTRAQRGFRIRIVGGDSGSPLPGVPTRLVRGADTLASGTTDAHGELAINGIEIRDDDLAETTVGLPGFVEGRARVWQAPADGVLEVSLHYEFRPEPATGARLDKAQRARAAALQEWTTIHPDLASVLSLVSDTISMPLSRLDEWPRAMLRTRTSSHAWHAALATAAERWNQEVRSLLTEAQDTDLSTVPVADDPDPPPALADAPWAEWLARPSPRLDETAKELVGLRARTTTIAHAGLRRVMDRWLDLIQAELVPITDPVVAAARRLNVEAQVAAIRWMLSSRTWAQRVGARR
jgi:hypothetical protein